MTSLPRMQSSFHALDWAIIAIYLVAMAAIGVYFSRRQTSLDRYLLAERSMGWLPVGLSLMAALNSGMDYLMQPSSTIRYGIVLDARHRVVAAALSMGRAGSPFRSITASNFYIRLRVSRGALRCARAHARRGDLHRLAARLDGDGDVRAEPRDQRRHRRPGRSQHHDHRRRRAWSRSTRCSAASRR